LPDDHAATIIGEVTRGAGCGDTKCWHSGHPQKLRREIEDAGLHPPLAPTGPTSTKESRLTWHFTPTHSSWLNQVERWFALLSQRQIKRGSHCSVRELESAILEFIEVYNEKPKPFVWTKNADAILNSIGRFASRTLDAHGANNM
jgi:transposase